MIRDTYKGWRIGRGPAHASRHGVGMGNTTGEGSAR